MRVVDKHFSGEFLRNCQTVPYEILTTCYLSCQVYLNIYLGKYFKKPSRCEFSKIGSLECQFIKIESQLLLLSVDFLICF